MSCKWPDEPACKRVWISNPLTCTVMSDRDMYLENVDIDELAMSASELLDQYRKRGINDTIYRRVLNNACCIMKTIQRMEFMWSAKLNVRLSGSSHIRFESHRSLSYLEVSDKTIPTYAREISNKRHSVHYIQRQMCTSHSSKFEHEWHLFLFLWSSSLIEGRFSVQWGSRKIWYAGVRQHCPPTGLHSALNHLCRMYSSSFSLDWT